MIRRMGARVKHRFFMWINFWPHWWQPWRPRICTLHGGMFSVGDPPRCCRCGHRLPVNGVPPKATRRMAPWKWPGELAGRRKARTTSA